MRNRPRARSWPAGLVGAAALLAACTSSVAGPDSHGPLSLVSSAFARGGSIPVTFSCSGADVAPPLTWHGATPAGTSTWAIVMTDLDVRPGPWVQWLVTGIPLGTRTVSADAIPAAAQISRASNGTRGYVGACPPTGAVHRYEFTLYAVGGKAKVSAAATATDTVSALARGAVGQARIVASFAR
ncbi:MAG TPA: YbhB/YbcL family Raf kinase inhibitor-like protein [Jatrophihabitans sp.]|jgi:hypothetical protein|uniref:YbhB/YbcL family Raf kinase inhibitor-like protein n=1 Tax=Jatrophihabitans sp. TaxID=1932789 RepID=UPI002E048AD4|nr:YbhB/YbcL family Raf kinase inhibitor-like protein [Jatrophihabitans sp.]